MYVCMYMYIHIHMCVCVNVVALCVLRTGLPRVDEQALICLSNK